MVVIATTVRPARPSSSDSRARAAQGICEMGGENPRRLLDACARDGHRDPIQKQLARGDQQIRVQWLTTNVDDEIAYAGGQAARNLAHAASLPFST